MFQNLCCFYASDYHFEVMSLPHIHNDLQLGNKIIIFTETDLQETIEKVVKLTNFKDDEKQKIMKINWRNNTQDKFDNLDNSTKTIFVKGSKKYIDDVIAKIKDVENSKIICCYEIDEVASEVTQIIEKYDAVLNTVGKIDM